MANNQLIEHLKTSWFKYVFEIVVVVFGILIALRLDNSKDQRKTEAVEIMALKQIHNGLARLEEEVSVNLEDELNALQSCEFIIKNFDTNQGLTDSLEKAFTLGWFYTYLQPDYGPYEYVNNYGASVITNSNIREIILNLYGLDLKAIVGESQIRAHYIERIKPQMAAWYTSMNPNTYDLTPTKPWDYESLRVDKTFRFHLTTQQKECIRWSRELNGLKEHIGDVMQLVSDEINKLEDN